MRANVDLMYVQNPWDLHNMGSYFPHIWCVAQFGTICTS